MGPAEPGLGWWLNLAILVLCPVLTSRTCLWPASSLWVALWFGLLVEPSCQPWTFPAPCSGTLGLGPLHIGRSRVRKRQIWYSRQQIWRWQFKAGKLYQSIILILFIIGSVFKRGGRNYKAAVERSKLSEDQTGFLKHLSVFSIENNVWIIIKLSKSTQYHQT